MGLTWRINEDEDGLTLAAVVRKRLRGEGGADVPWSRARELCARGKVSLDGAPALDPAARVARGQEAAIDEHAKRPQSASAAAIVFEDAHVVVIDKPAGISSVPFTEREKGTAMDAIREAWRHQGRAATAPLLIVHRIDKETSGLLAFAKTKLAESGLNAQFKAHTVERTYLCAAQGRVSGRRLESMLVVDRGDGLRGTAPGPGQGKRAVTHVRVVEELPLATLCEVALETGRTHQIRIHLAEAGHPLVGEKVYVRDLMSGGGKPLPAARLMLHAATLGFEHPATKKRVRLSSAPPADFAAELARLRR